MLMNRIMGALTFKKEVYAEVEQDESFTQTAWLLVAVVSLISQLGTQAGYLSTSFIAYLVSVIVGTIVMVIGFAVGAFLVSWAGKTFFQADTDFSEMVRCLGLAFVWNAIGIFGILSVIAPFLACILSPVTILAGLAGLAAWVFAAKEALDLDWGKTIITILIGWVASFLINLITGAILGVFGFVTAMGAGLLTQ